MHSAAVFSRRLIDEAIRIKRALAIRSRVLALWARCLRIARRYIGEARRIGPVKAHKRASSERLERVHPPLRPSQKWVPVGRDLRQRARLSTGAGVISQ